MIVQLQKHWKTQKGKNGAEEDKTELIIISNLALIMMSRIFIKIINTIKI